jgi:hypothetical protein
MIVYNSDGFGSYSRYLDLEGNPIEKTPDKYPYSYDDYIIYQTRDKATDGCYSDRLRQWDYTLTRNLITKHFPERTGDYYPRSSPELVEGFLRDRLNNPKLELVHILEGCNVSNGYPYWYFGYIDGSE